MSLTVPLAVRLATSRADRHVTYEARDLSFRSVAPGGFASATVDLDRPLSLLPDEIAYYGRLVVYDARSGNTVWEGRLEDPGRGAGSDGQVWRLAAVGPSAHANDRTAPLFYVDRGLTSLERVDNATPDGTATTGDDPGGHSQALTLTWPNGTTLPTAARVCMRHDLAQRTGQKLARVAFSWDAGFTSASFAVEAFTRLNGGLATGEAAVSQPFNSGGGTGSAVVVTHFPNGRNTVEFRVVYYGAATVAGDGGWGSVYNAAVRALLLDRTGNEITTGYTADTVLASEVVADLLGRLLTQYDGAAAQIATTSYPIDQLAWPDGISASGVLTELMRLEPDYYWAAWETGASGKHRFEWRAWPTMVRYEADAVDGFDSPGSADGLYNAVIVRYLDASGAIRTVRRTQSVGSLTAAGLTREGFIDLGDVTGSDANAIQVGDRWLADHKFAPNAGRLTVARPILDLVAGRMVMPWEIRPGNLIRVRGVLPRQDALNATSRDGVAVFRVVGSTFRAATASAELELDSHAPTVARAIADLQRRPFTARR